MTPPPYVLSQGVLGAIGDGILQVIVVRIGNFHEAIKPYRAARTRVPRCKQHPKAHLPYEGHARIIIKGRWGDYEFTGKCANVI
jgi:hypothetical protein